MFFYFFIIFKSSLLSPPSTLWQPTLGTPGLDDTHDFCRNKCFFKWQWFRSGNDSTVFKMTRHNWPDCNSVYAVLAHMGPIWAIKGSSISAVSRQSVMLECWSIMWARSGPDVVWQASMDCLRIVLVPVQSKVFLLCVNPWIHYKTAGRVEPTMSAFHHHFIIKCLPDGPFYLFHPTTFRRNRREGFVVLNAKSIFLPPFILSAKLLFCCFFALRATQLQRHFLFLFLLQ